MKTHIQNLFIVLVLLAGLHHTSAQGTAFTYQGRLSDGGQPANEHYDILFQPYDAELGGNTIPLEAFVANLTVSNGLFTAQLDFGDGIFNGTNLLDGNFREAVRRQQLHYPRTPAAHHVHAPRHV
jgi:hypothetical protein